MHELTLHFTAGYILYVCVMNKTLENLNTKFSQIKLWNEYYTNTHTHKYWQSYIKMLCRGKILTKINLLYKITCDSLDPNVMEMGMFYIIFNIRDDISLYCQK